MANPWFRLYSEFATDPKVQMLSEADQRRYLMLLCLRCSNDDETLHDDQVAFQLRISNEDWLCTKSILVARNLITDDSKPVAWEKRQYVSDSSTSRVAAYRDRQRNGVKQACNVSETAPDTDTDTDTEEEKEQKTLGASADAPSGYSPEFEMFWSEYPKRAGQNSKKSASKKFTARLREGVKADDLILAAKRYADQMRATGKYGTEFVKQADTFLGPNEHWREALSSNIHPFKGARAELKPGDFEYFDPETGKTRICNEATHDRYTGQSLKWMAQMGLKP